MANLAGELSMRVSIDGRVLSSHPRYAWSAGGLVLTITIVLPEAGLAFELISTYTGHRDTDTTATHLTLGQDRSAEIATYRHSHEQIDPSRACTRLRL